ncbi:MAG: AsmA family protein [Coxiellaceae bacterium]|nr:AsmA family protein [Coxiellaceae bacterium]
MKSLAKVIGYIVLILIAILIIAAILLKTMVNPNDYRDKITQLVKQKTGRTLLIQGEIKLQYFPWLGVDVKQVTLQNPAGFSPNPFMKVGDAAIKMKLFPLFWGNVEIKNIALNDATINLITQANGTTNWGSKPTNASNTTKSSKPAANNNNQQVPSKKSKAEISIANIEIDNANVHVINRQTGQRFDLTYFNLDSSDFNLNGDSFFIKTKFSLAQAAPQLKLTMKASANIAIDQSNNDVKMSDVNVSGTIYNLYATLKKPVHFNTSFEKLVVNQQKFELEGYVSQIANLTVKADLNADRDDGLKRIKGTIEIPNFDPNTFAKALNLQTKGSQQFQLKKASADIKINTNNDTIILDPFTIKLDDATVNAKAVYTTKPKTNLQFSVNANKLNLDEILPASKNNRPSTGAPVNKAIGQAVTGKSSPAATNPGTKTTSPYDTNWQGKINIGSLIVNKITFNNLRIHTTNNAGHITLAPITANLYGGDVNAQATMLANKTIPDYSFSASIAHVNLGKALMSIAHKNVMDGKANFSTQLTSSGNTQGTVMRNLSGNGQLLVNNGKLFGFNLDKLVAQATAFLKQGKVGKPQLSTGNETNFSRLSGSYHINHGILTNNDLALLTNGAMASGRGQINMVNQTINYRMQVGPRAPTIAQQPWNFPLVISGSLDHPKITPNIASIVGQVIKKVIQDQTKKTGKQIQQFFKGLFN